MVDGVSKDDKEVKADLASLSKEFYSTVIKINAINTTMEKLLNEQTKNSKNENDNTNKLYQSKIDKIFKIHQLKLSDYEETDKEPRKNGRVTKWVSRINKAEEFAFKNILDKDN